jgi:RnfABCDGE-type electron transport complex C subunit
MLKLFSAFRKNKIRDFAGGIHPPEMKSQSSGTPLRQIPLAPRFVIPLKQHIGAEGELCVSVGDRVLRGQPLTRGRGRMLPVHAPTSGVVVAIAPHSTAHPSALAELSVIIDADGEDRWIARDGWTDYRTRSRDELIARIHQFGVAGLGGAGFPTGVKLQGGGDKINTLIVNAAECEPYITADDRLMQECAAQIVEGIRILAHILQPHEILIGIEDNKPQAISMLRAVLADSQDIALRVIPTKYPSGGAKQLTQILTGKQVPHGGRSSDIGVLMQNVGTAYAVKRAVIDGEPLTERVVTLTGEAVARPGNVWARLGTPVHHLLSDAGFRPVGRADRHYGRPADGVHSALARRAGGQDHQLPAGPPPPASWARRRKKRAAFAAAPAPTPARPICCPSSSTGSAEASSTTRRPPTISPTVSSAEPAPGSVRAIFPWCAISARRRRRSTPSARKRQRASRGEGTFCRAPGAALSAKKRPARRAISTRRHSLRTRIRTRFAAALARVRAKSEAGAGD